MKTGKSFKDARFGKNDPWVMAKIGGFVAQEEMAVLAAQKKNSGIRIEYEAAKSINMHADRFAAFKVSTDGNNRKWGYQRGKTLSECTDMEAYPAGRHIDLNGEYFWSYALESTIA